MIIDHILKETVSIQNDVFHIVEDKFPICEGHFLAFSKSRYRAFLKHGLSEIFDLLSMIQNYRQKAYFFYERGNASFCTSIDGPICAHLHLLPKDSFNPKVLEELRIETNAILKNYESLIQNVNDEYFLFGSKDQLFYKVLSDKPQKRYLRRYFENKVL